MTVTPRSYFYLGLIWSLAVYLNYRPIKITVSPGNHLSLVITRVSDHFVPWSDPSKPGWHGTDRQTVVISLKWIGIVAFENLLGLTVFQSSFLSFVTFDIMIYCLKLLFSSCCCQLFLAPEDGLAYEPKYWANLFERIQALCIIIAIITDITLFIISSFCRRD